VTAPIAPERTLRRQLVTLTGAKIVSNTALRWVGPFLPTLERAFSASTGTLTGIIGAAELGGLTTLLTGSHLDRGRERTVYALGLAAVAASSVIALAGSVTLFAASYVVLVLGVANLTVAGHTWIGHRYPYATRSRAIGVFETSWALALLAGAPLVALLIRSFGWRGPYVALAIGAALASIVVLRSVDAGTPHADQDDRGRRVRLPAAAWLALFITPAIAATGMGVFIVSGSWLDDAHGVSTAGLGLIAAGFGAVELVSSTSVAVLTDRIGARRSVVIGMVVVLAGNALMIASGESQMLAVAGLAMFLAGFEYSIVSSLTLVTEAAPNARGRAIGLSNAFGTLARAAAVAGAGQLYDRFGMTGPITLTSSTAVVAIMITLASGHHSRAAG
jgi:predicted MFS family arabinose efflux permease